mgnify:CR=1 FL=1
MWRLAHHRSNVADDGDPGRISFWYTPRPNVSPDGRWWMLYHSYDADNLDAGRQLLLDPIRWTRDGWPVVNRGRGPSGSGAPPTG